MIDLSDLSVRSRLLRVMVKNHTCTSVKNIPLQLVCVKNPIRTHPALLIGHTRLLVANFVLGGKFRFFTLIPSVMRNINIHLNINVLPEDDLHLEMSLMRQ